MTPNEAAAAARELAEWLERMDALPYNGEAIYDAWSEAKELVTTLAGYVDFQAVTA